MMGQAQGKLLGDSSEIILQPVAAFSDPFEVEKIN